MPTIWGIVNVTPDSFSDGGLYATTASAVAHGLALVAAGAEVLDVGGESTRPGAAPVSVDVELRRVIPVLRDLAEARTGCTLSIDTQNGAVAQAALEAGATIINDVSAGRHDPSVLDLVALRGAGIVLMHMRKTPLTMQDAPVYDDVVEEVLEWLLARAAVAEQAGIPRSRIWIDPGIGFGKTLEHNLALLKHLERFTSQPYNVLLGTSRKSFLGRLTGRDVTERLPGSLATVARAMVARVDAIRVHDVGPTHDLLTVLQSIT